MRNNCIASLPTPLCDDDRVQSVTAITIPAGHQVRLEVSRPDYWWLGQVSLRREDISKAREFFQRAIELIEDHSGKGAPDVHYQWALYHALMDEKAEALDALRRAQERGFADERVHLDLELDSLRGDPEFEALANRIHSRTES